MDKLVSIKNDRERQFASTFFDHEEWKHHPQTIYFKGGKYTADFYDKRRGVYIEVVGTRQAFAVNRYKYLYLMEVKPDIKLEFRSHTGKLLDPYRLSLSDGDRGGYMTRERRFEATGIMPDGYALSSDAHDALKELLLRTNWSLSEMSAQTGVNIYNLSLILGADKGGRLIKKNIAQDVLRFKREWDENPRKFPARRGYAVMTTRRLLGIKTAMKEYYCPDHPTNSFFDDALKTRGPKKFKPPHDPAI